MSEARKFFEELSMEDKLAVEMKNERSFLGYSRVGLVRFIWLGFWVGMEVKGGRRRERTGWGKVGGWEGWRLDVGFGRIVRGEWKVISDWASVALAEHGIRKYARTVIVRDKIGQIISAVLYT